MAATTFYYKIFAIFVSFIVISIPKCEAGTWLSFNQKTGGIDVDSLIPQRSVSTMKGLEEGDLMKLAKVCNDQLRKRVSRRSSGGTDYYYNRQEKRDAAMCRSFLELVSRR